MAETKLNLGCYKDIKEGYVNVDKEQFFKGIDKVVNLEKTPYPFENNTFDEVLAYLVLEHLNINRIEFYDELHRICKAGAIIKIKVPFKDKILRNPDHKGMPFSFMHFTKLCGVDDMQGYATKNKFKLIKLDYSKTAITRFIPKKITYYLSFFIGEMIENIYVEIKVVK